MTHLIVFCHLRWDFVYQRPQHVLSRLARHHPVVFIEEPVREAPGTGPWLETRSCAPGVTALRVHTDLDAPGFTDAQMALMKPLIQSWLDEHGIRDFIAWYYTPMALPLGHALRPRAVVYDCMDELRAFKGAPPELGQREAQLLRAADVVFTGGPSLYEAKRERHAHVLCLPSAVDAAHYTPRRGVPADAASRRALAMQGHIGRPRLGFFGVIDERLDIGLLAALADEEPAWQIVMVGPVVKIDPAGLPRRANIHWLGQQPYALLPYLVSGWDVCLLPFAINESTRFISPTKTLEYMAAEKPVVSTAIHDVVTLYGDLVRVGTSAADFVSACAQALHEPASSRARRVRMMRRRVAKYSWETTVAHMAAVLATLLPAASVVEPVRIGTPSARSGPASRHADGARLEAN